MATRGRKPKPTAMKLIDGNPGRTPVNMNEPKPPQDGMECPEYLSELAKYEWERIVPTLVKLGIATNADKTLLEAYCLSYATYREMQNDIALNGYTFRTQTGYMQQRPQVGIMNTAQKQMQSIASEFGLSPASRARIHGSDGDSRALDADPMESILKGKWA